MQGQISFILAQVAKEGQVREEHQTFISDILDSLCSYNVLDLPEDISPRQCVSVQIPLTEVFCLTPQTQQGVFSIGKYNIFKNKVEKNVKGSIIIPEGCRSLQYDNNTLLISGGKNTQTEFRIESNSDSQEFTMLHPRSFHGMIFRNYRVYLISGKQDDKSLQFKCEYFDWIRKKFNKIAEIPVAVTDFGISYFNEDIYVFGGESNVESQYEIQSYKTLEDKWQLKNVNLLLPSRIVSINIKSDIILLFAERDLNESSSSTTKIKTLFKDVKKLQKCYLFKGDIEEIDEVLVDFNRIFLPVRIGSNIYFYDKGYQVVSYNINSRQVKELVK